MFALFCTTLFAIALVAAMGTIGWMVKGYGRKMLMALAGEPVMAVSVSVRRHGRHRPARAVAPAPFVRYSTRAAIAA